MRSWNIAAVVLLQEDPEIKGTLVFQVQAEDFDKAVAAARELTPDYELQECVEAISSE